METRSLLSASSTIPRPSPDDRTPVRPISVPPTRPRSRRSDKFDFVPVPVPPVSPVPPVPPIQPTTSRPLSKRELNRAKKKKMNASRKWQVDLGEIYPRLLASLPLPEDYKTCHLLDPVEDVSTANLLLLNQFH